MMRYTDMLSDKGTTVLGLCLRPLSLGHVMHMQREGNLFMSPTKVRLLTGEDPLEDIKRLNAITLELIIATLICSMKYEEFDEFITGETFVSEMARWSDAVQQLAAKGKLNVIEEIQRFWKYLEKGYQKPTVEYLMENKQPSGSSENWPHTVVFALCSEANYDRTTALNQPLNLSFLDFYGIAQKNGVLRIINDTEEELIRKALEQEKGILNGS